MNTLRIRPTKQQRLRMLLRRGTTLANAKYASGGALKRKGPKPITLAPIGRSDKP